MQNESEMNRLVSLPYINNIRLIALTVFIQIAAIFIFFSGALNGSISQEIVLYDAAYAGGITAFIDVFIVWHCLRKMRMLGRLPGDVPRNRFMLLLPRNPLCFSILLSIIFGLLTPFGNYLILRLYDVTSLTFEQFAVWRIIYTTVLSVYIVQIAIFRYVQPDFACETEVPQTGSESVINPVPHISIFKEWFDTVTADFGFQVLSGLLLGGTVISNKCVIVTPTALSGIFITASVLSLIIAVRMAYPVAKNIRKNIRESGLSGSVPLSPYLKNFISCLPERPTLFACALIPPFILLSWLFFRGIMSFFDFETLDLFQFFFIRTLFVAFLSKCVVKLAIMRYLAAENQDLRK